MPTYYKFDYAIRNDADEIIDSSDGGESLSFVEGDGSMITGLESALLGKDTGDKFSVTLGPDEAYGWPQRQLIRTVSKDMIQTDAAINSGNSGGPLLNALGEVIGINAVIYTPNQGSIGLGFAIPINRVKMIADELKEKGKIERNFWTGLKVQSVDKRVARYFELEKAEGVIVSHVAGGSPGARSNLRPGDIILEVNGESLRTEDHLVGILSERRAGDELRLKILREKRVMNVTLLLEERPT